MTLTIGRRLNRGTEVYKWWWCSQQSNGDGVGSVDVGGSVGLLVMIGVGAAICRLM